MRNFKRFGLGPELALLVALILTLTACSDDMMLDADAGENLRVSRSQHVAPGSAAAGHTYTITIENLTDGQPFSPGVVTTHTRGMHLFEVGATASSGIRDIAESGNPSTAVSELNESDAAHDVVATGSPIGPGRSLTVEIEGRANANRLSLAVMLVCTNDGFTGVDHIKLPDGFTSETYDVAAYDAGTETSETIVDGCGLGSDGNARAATDVPIAVHNGIQGTGNLDPAVHGWTDPVARITVQRMK